MHTLSTYKYECLALALIEEASRPGLTREVCAVLFDTLVLKLMTSKGNFEHDRRTTLAAAVCIVGAHRIEYFKQAFTLVAEWENVGGCYWVIQIELLSHVATYELKYHSRMLAFYYNSSLFI